MHPNDPFTHALGTEDQHEAYRVLRAWLQTVRDRLTVEAAAHLFELLRGVYYEGWTPAHVPTRYDVPGFTARFAGSAGIALTEVPAAAAAVTAALDRLCSPGQLGHVMKLMPSRLAEVLTGDRRAR